MKHFRGTFVFAMLVVAVAAVALWQVKKSNQEDADKPSVDLMFGVVLESSVIEFNFTGQLSKFKMQKEAGHWHVVEPIKDDADDTAVDGAITQLLESHATQVESGDGPIDWPKYGLNDPDPTVQLKLNTGQTLQLRFGKVRTYDNGFYLRKNEEPKLYTAAATLERIRGLMLNSLRSKKLKLPEGAPIQFSVTSTVPEKTYHYSITKKENTWSESTDKKMKVMDKLVTDFIDDVRGVAAVAIVADSKDAEDLKKYELQKPSATFSFEFQNPEGPDKTPVSAEVKFGAIKGNDVFYVTSLSQSIYQLGKSRFEGLLRAPDAFRDKKDPFLFETSKAIQVKFVSPDFKNGLQLQKTNGLWEQSKKDPGKSVNDPVVTDFINNIQGLEAAEFLASGAKPAPHDFLAEIKGEKGETLLKIEFGGLYKDPKSNQEYYVVKTSKIDKLMAVRKPSMDRLTKPNLIQDANKPAQTTETKKVEQQAREQLTPEQAQKELARKVDAEKHQVDKNQAAPTPRKSL